MLPFLPFRCQPLEGRNGPWENCIGRQGPEAAKAVVGCQWPEEPPPHLQQLVQQLRQHRRPRVPLELGEGLLLGLLKQEKLKKWQKLPKWQGKQEEGQQQ